MHRKLISLILFLGFAIVTAYGQDSLHQEKSGFFYTLRAKLKGTKKLSTTNVNESSRKTLPTVKSGNISLLDSVNGFKNLAERNSRSKADSVNNISKALLQLNVNEDSLQKMQAKTSNLNQPTTEKIKGGTDDFSNPLNQKKDSISRSLEQVQDIGNNKVEDISGKVNSSTAKVSEKVNGRLEIPADNATLQALEINRPDGVLPLPNGGNGLPATAIELPSSDFKVKSDLKIDVKNPSGDLNTPTAPTIGNVPDGDVPNRNGQLPTWNVDGKIPAINKIQGSEDKLNEVDSKLAIGEKYEQDFKNLKEGKSGGKLEADAEAAIAEQTKVKSLTSQVDKLTKQQQANLAMLQKYRDKKLEKEELLRKAKGIANEKLNKFSPDVTKVTDRVGQGRKIKSTFERLKSVYAKRSNAPLKDKPLHERFAPGITLQAINNGVYNLDLNPRIGYKLSNTFLVGVEGCYRISVNRGFQHWVETPGVYGYRIYNNVKLIKGAFLHTEFEQLKFENYVHDKLKLEQLHQQVTNFNVGLGKKHSISKKINGYMLVFYRVELNGHIPAVNKLFVRVGFDLNTKKKRKLGEK